MFPPVGEESVEVVQTVASGGTSTKEESKYSLVRLYISSCLRAPWDPQAGTGEKDICNACLVCCHCDAISFGWMDGWKEIKQSNFVLTLQIPDIDFKMYPLLAEGILKLFYLCGCYWASFSLLPYIFLSIHAVNKTLTSFFLNKIIARFGGLMLRDGQSVTWNHPHRVSVAFGCEQLSLPPTYKGLRKSTAETSSLALDMLMKLHFSTAPWKHNGT